MTFTQFAVGVQQFADDLAEVALPRIAPALRDVVRRHATGRDTKGTGRYMGFPIDATHTIHGDTVIVSPRPVGPWAMLEHGSRKKEWQIGPGDKVLTIGGDFRRRVTHKGIRARRTWTRTLDEMSDVFHDMARAEASKLWGQVGG